MTTTSRLPRIVPLVLVVALVAGLNSVWPELLPAVIVLLALYLVTVYSDRARELIATVPNTLGSGFKTTRATAAAGGSQTRKTS